MSTTTCPACGAGDIRIFHEQLGVPVNSCLLLDDRETAQAFPRGDLVLGFCRACGFISNTAFDPVRSEYSSRYEETQGFSPRFRAFSQELARTWVERHGLQGRSVLEIGCGKGEFLVDMVEAGAGSGIGIDPSFRADRMDSAAAQRIQFIADFYSDAYAHLGADAVVCRHTLEHLPAVADFVALVRRSIGDRTTTVLFELPDVARVLEEVAFWDVYYEHCSYFSLGSMARLFRAQGFDVTHLDLAFGDQYLLLDAVAGADAGTGPPRPLPGEDDMARLEAAVDHFEAEYPRRVAALRDDLRGAAGSGRRTVIWGAGSKGVSYLTTLALENEIEVAVDINPHKQGMYMAGTGQRIVGPEFLAEYRPDLVVAMNDIYLDEIRAELDRVGVAPELVGA
ncbi:MAG TPA: class I SAM-dependent methyltransferase [Acidimicrobiales bacterium]|nr:class I SAM-dependent methyltransferase [Acidimicrobiales bacterium]